MLGDHWRETRTYERGTIMRKGPLIRLCSMRYVIKAMVWMVLPRPISSARMPFRLLLYSDTSHSKPLIYGGKKRHRGMKRIPLQMEESRIRCANNAHPHLTH